MSGIVARSRAPKERKITAHGASRGETKPQTNQPRRGARKVAHLAETSSFQNKFRSEIDRIAVQEKYILV